MRGAAFVRLFIGLGLVASLIGCANSQPAVDRVGVNVVDKELFRDSSWYFSRTVIDVDYEGGGLGTFPGDSAYDYTGSDLGSVPRIRWVIDEKFLYAFRDYEMLEGGNPEGDIGEDFISHPVAAFPIEKHFDIQRAYNAANGEEQNIIVENDTDRPWYQRDYMRVNWAMNALPAYYGQTADLYALIGFFERQPAELFIQAESAFPDSWRPRFHFMGCGENAEEGDCDEHEAAWSRDYDEGQLYAFDFVTQELLAPGDVPDPFTGAATPWCLSVYADAPTCTTTAAYVRNSFLRVSDKRQYEPVNWTDSRFERAGYFRLERPTYDRSNAPDDPSFGATDFLNYNINRHNIWYNWYTESTNEAGETVRTPVPLAEREVRPIVFYTTSEMPAHLIQPSFQVGERWNEVFMQTVRQLQGRPSAQYPEVACQDQDPDGYCACVRDPASGDVLNPTCAGQYDPFESPAHAEARGAIDPYDCYVNVPDGARPNLNQPDLTDSDFYGWFGAKQEGSECVLVTRVNSCNLATIAENGGTTDGLNCQERGDARFKFMSYVDQPGTPFLGIATLRGDPVTGEIFFGDANTGGPALDGYRTSALQMYDLVNGDLTDQEFLTGEDVRSYLANLGRVQLPARPQSDFNVAVKNGASRSQDRAAIDNRMAAFVARAELLAGPEGRANTYVDRRAKLKGTDIERRIMENVETLAIAGVNNLPDGYGPADIDDEILDKVSPFRVPINEQMRSFVEAENRASGANVMMPNEFVDDSVMSFVNLHKDWPRARLEIAINRLLYFQTQIHELGHCLGLRHDFGGSVDSGNFDDEYYQISERFPLPNPESFDNDGTTGLSSTEQLAFEDAYEEARTNRELAGIDRYMSSSIMDYTAQWYERVHTQAGRYDIAAVSYGYGDLVELYDNEAGRAVEDILPSNTKRAWAKYYHGGEICNVDADCPYSTSGAAQADLNPVNRASGITQTCVAHPSGEATHGRICSNFDDDALAAVQQSTRYLPIAYRFCSDDRVGTLGWCHRFDEGENYREIVRNVAEAYERQYIFTNFRRYRSNFSIGGYLFDRLIGRHFQILQDVFQNMLYRYQIDEEFRTDTNDLGFYDQFFATADILNFYARILGQPDIGSYDVDAITGNLARLSTRPGVPGSKLDISIGLGRYLFSTYQTGLTGITRLERIGSFYEKWIVMQMLTQRGWTTSYTRDVPFWTNYYDLFPVEMQQIFQGLIQDKPESISPRLSCDRFNGAGKCMEPHILYMDFYRGDCSNPATCRPDPVTETYAGLDVIDGGNSVLLQYLAAVFSLSDFPVFFDTTFQNQLFICVEGQGDCFQPNPDAVEGVDFVRYQSPRFGKTFMAWQVEPSVAVPNQESIGFKMVTEARNNDFIIEVLQRAVNGSPPTSEELTQLDDIGYTYNTATQVRDLDLLDGRQQDLESFFFQIIELERQLGVASFLQF